MFSLNTFVKSFLNINAGKQNLTDPFALDYFQKVKYPLPGISITVHQYIQIRNLLQLNLDLKTNAQTVYVNDSVIKRLEKHSFVTSKLKFVFRTKRSNVDCCLIHVIVRGYN
jgi:hypothetical protein